MIEKNLNTFLSPAFTATLNNESQKIDKYITEYRHQLEQGDVQKAYHYLMRFISHLKTRFSKNSNKRFTCGYVSPGNMDFTYFPFFNQFLRKRKLRFGIVLNHKELRFELWLLGQNASIQNAYWEKLKNTVWNAERVEMPKYSILEAVLVETPVFENFEQLTTEIIDKALDESDKIIKILEDCEIENN